MTMPWHIVTDLEFLDSIQVTNYIAALRGFLIRCPLPIDCFLRSSELCCSSSLPLLKYGVIIFFGHLTVFIQSLRENTILLSQLSYRDLFISSCPGLVGLLETLTIRDLNVPGVSWRQ
ncbi:hypothetical protein N7G274_010158 [Stereocaulon virgatum]|uniref:Uncharacterized protein n=1 Tax=Stereocaulon virgatum TaxID=373712 RepID=A0ABR3ZUA5_9LECA